jgi:hypothetical protein
MTEVVLPIQVYPLDTRQWSAKLDTSVTLPSGLTSHEDVVIAQQFEQDVLADISNAFQTFVETGQVWALLIGIVLGYLLKSITTF